MEIVRLADHHVMKTITTNAKLKRTVSALARGPVDFTQIDNGHGTKLDCATCHRPHGPNGPARPLFTSLKEGMQQMVDALLTRLPASSLRTGDRSRHAIPVRLRQRPVPGDLRICGSKDLRIYLGKSLRSSDPQILRSLDPQISQ